MRGQGADAAAAAAAAAPGSVLVMGAGAIGCYLGGCLQAAGARVVLVGRPRVLDELRVHGLRCSDLDGGDARSRGWRTAAGASATAGCESCPRAAVREERRHRRGRAHARARRCLPGRWWCRCRTAWPMRRMPPGRPRTAGPGRHGSLQRRRARPGALPPRHRPAHSRSSTTRSCRPGSASSLPLGVPLQLHRDLGPIQWAKLLLNLNNPLNALSGRPLRSQLLERDSRRCLAALQEEGLRRAARSPASNRPAHAAAAALAAAGCCACRRRCSGCWRRKCCASTRKPAPAWPTTSLAGGLPEIDALCGEIVRLARRHGVAAPVNERMVALIGRAACRPAAVERGRGAPRARRRLKAVGRATDREGALGLLATDPAGRGAAGDGCRRDRGRGPVHPPMPGGASQPSSTAAMASAVASTFEVFSPATHMRPERTR